MNIGEASAAQALLKYLLDPHETDLDASVRAHEAARELAERSHQTLGTGLRGADVDLLWADMMEGCEGCDECLRPIETVPVAGDRL